MLFLLSVQDGEIRNKAERLYYSYRTLMYKAAYDILQDKHLAEDAISESFMKIIKNLHKIDEENCPRTRNFLVIICRNTAIDIYKKHKKQAYYDESTETFTDASFDSPEDFVITKESLAVAAEAIKSLKPIYRDVIFLTRVYGYSREEAAKMLSVSVETVKKRITRANKMLLDELKRQKII